MTIEFKTLLDESNKLIETLRTEAKAKDSLDEQKFAKIEGELAGALSQKQALETRLNALETAAARPTAGKSAEVADEVKTAFFDLMRKSNDYGLEQAYTALAKKSFNTATPEDGGFAVPAVVSQNILAAARDYSPIRQLARVIQVASPKYSELVGGSATSGWSGETGVRGATETPKLTNIEYAFGEVYARPTVSNHALTDVFFNLESWLIEKAAEQFAEEEGKAFLNGTGVNMPKGIFADNRIATVKSGVAAAMSANPYDTLIDIMSGLKGTYRQNSTWLMNSATLAALSKVKTADGTYIYQPNVAAGVASTLLGRPVALDEGFDAVGAGKKPILLADMSRLYTIADVTGMSVITDNITNKGFTEFYVAKRVGGGVTLAEAGRALEIKA